MGACNNNITQSEKFFVRGYIKGNIKNKLEKNKELEKFMTEIKIQDYLSENKKKSKDENFKKLQEFENEKFKDVINQKISYYKSEILDNGKLNLNIKNEDNLISSIIYNEKSPEIYKEKIINEIKAIKNDENQYKIDHLTILLVGRKGVGKTTLIKYMLKIDEKEKSNDMSINYNEKFTIYKSSRVPHLQFIEFKGIGYNKNSDPELIGREAVECIKNMINSNKSKNYNDFIHCIWYCITGTRFEDSEINVFEKLKKSYNDISLPIIVVYTQTIDQILSNQMNEYIKNLGLETSFVNVLAKDIKLLKSTKIIKSFGEEDLLKETLLKFNKALKGDMINLITNIISEFINNKLKKENISKMNKIKDNIIQNFINDYQNILTDEELKKYIVEMLGSNLILFYQNYINKISNKSLNLLKNSNIIREVDNFMEYYKKEVDIYIIPIIKEESELFLDEQASKEKKGQNLRLENKRSLHGFSKTNSISLKRNFYYISQKYIINSIIKNICSEYLEKYRNKLDNIVILLLENKDQDIKNCLDECFLTKLEKYIKDKNINIKIEYPLIKYVRFYPFIPEEKFDIGDINQKSIELVDNFNDSKEEEIHSKIQEIIKNDKWYPFKQINLKYLNDNSKDLLYQFLEKDIIYQDSYFSKKDNDIVFNSLKEYEKNDLINFFESQKINFIKETINEVYSTKYIYYKKLSISKIISSKEFENVYINKINKEIEKINIDKNICKIHYLSIILIGKSGVGKSTLLNAILKKELAKTGPGGIITMKDKAYKSNEIPFLRLYDTRGIELDKKYGPEKIFQNTLNIINSQIKSNNYNDYIQCIWYCINNSEVEKEEIELIKKLRENQKSVPLIVVFTNAQKEEIVNKVGDIIKENFKDINFIPVLAKGIEKIIESFGLDDLLEETLKICKKSTKGDIYQKIRKISSNKIENILRERNKLIKIKSNNIIVKKFVDNFKKVLSEKEFIEFIYCLLEELFVININSNENQNIMGLSKENKDLLKEITNIPEYIKNYIEYYIKCTQKIVEPILYKKSIEYLDVQVRKEKNFGKNIININKCNKSDFQKIIEKFLNDNFYYISQKYIIYRLIIDVNEPISERIELSINDLIKYLLYQNSQNDLLKIIYDKKFEDLEEIINGYRNKNNNKIYEDKNNQIEVISSIITNEENHEKRLSGYPAPAPINF